MLQSPLLAPDHSLVVLSGATVTAKPAGEPPMNSVPLALCPPATLPGSQLADARPAASVTVVSAANVPPLVAVQITVSPAARLPNASVACATSGAASGVPARPVCPPPDTG